VPGTRSSGATTRPTSWLYECEGPDGKRYDNRAIGTLRSLLRQRYPGAQLDEAWDHELTLGDAAAAMQR
jgi:hypothetical protein